MQARTLEYFSLSKIVNTNKSYEYLPPTIIFHQQFRLLHNAEKTLVPQLPVKDSVFTIPTDYLSINVQGLTERIFSKELPIKFNISIATYLKPNNLSAEQQPFKYSKGFLTKGHFHPENPIQFDDTINNSSDIRTDPNDFWKYYAENYDRESELLIKSPLSSRVESEPNYVFDIKTLDEHFKYYGHLKSAGSIEMLNVKSLKIVAHIQSQKNFKTDLFNFKNNTKFTQYFNKFNGKKMRDPTLKVFDVTFERERVIPYRYDAIFKMNLSVSMFQHFKSEIKLDSWNLYPSEKNGLYLDNNLDPLYKRIWPISAPFTHDENGLMNPVRFDSENGEQQEETEEEEESQYDDDDEEEEEIEESEEEDEDEHEDEDEDERREREFAIFHDEVEAMWMEYRIEQQQLRETRRRRRREREEEERATGVVRGQQEEAEEEEEQLEVMGEEELNPFGRVFSQDGSVEVYNWEDKDYCPEYRIHEREKIIKTLWLEHKLELLRMNIYGNNDNEIIWQQVPPIWQQAPPIWQQAVIEQENEQENEALWDE